MSLDKVNINAIAGRSFTSKSGNCGSIRRLADGAVRISWGKMPTDGDKFEFVAWLEAMLNCKLEATHSSGLEREADALASWLRRMG